MSSSATLVLTTPRTKCNTNIYSYNISHDGSSGDLTIRTPANANNRVFLIGFWMADTTANNITWKSGSNTLCVPECAANFNLIVPVYTNATDSWILATNVGEALIINCSAALTSAIVHVAEAKEL